MTDREILQRIEEWKNTEGDVTLRKFAMEAVLLIEQIKETLQVRGGVN